VAACDSPAQSNEFKAADRTPKIFPPVRACGNSSTRFSVTSHEAIRIRSDRRCSRMSQGFQCFAGSAKVFDKSFRNCTKIRGLTASLITRRFFSPSRNNSSQPNCIADRDAISKISQGWNKVRKESEWQVYRTRFLIRARQLTGPLQFRDALGREHRGQRGDYLVESSDGTQRIAPREIFEDVYVVMDSAIEKWPVLSGRDFSMSDLKRRAAARAEMLA
jgi:hypothetical protein